MMKLFSMAAGLALLAGAASAEPLVLADAQLDGVTAGEYTHFQKIWSDIKVPDIKLPDIKLKDDIAKATAAAVAEAPSNYNVFTFTFTDAIVSVNRTRQNVTATSLSEAVAVVSRSY